MEETERPRCAVGQVWAGPYGVQYQILAIWAEKAWVHIYFPRVSYEAQPHKDNPRTEDLSFFREAKGMRLLYSLADITIS
jgi:hypothetical protein